MLFSDTLSYRSVRSSLIPLDKNHVYLDQQYQQTDRPMQREKQKSQLYSQSIKPKQPKKYILQRYHDQSLISLQKRPLSYINKLANYLRNINIKIINKKRLFKQVIQTQQDQSLTFNPLSPYLCLWNILIGIFILFNFFQIPISICFTQQVYIDQFSYLFCLSQSPFGVTVNIITIILLAINIIYVVPNTQFYHNGFLVTSEEQTISKYIGWRLALDLIALLFQFIYTVSGIRETIYAKILFYAAIYRLLKIDQIIQRTIELTKFRLACYKLIRLILFLLFVITWLSSIFFAIDYYYYELQQQYYPYNLWLINPACCVFETDLIQTYSKQWYVWLDYAFYWCIQTVTMVGFGDNTPRNPHQVVFVSFVIMIVILLYVFFVSGVWEIISQAQEFTEYQRKQWKSFKEYQMQKIKPLEKTKKDGESKRKFRELKNKVGSYLFEMWNEEQIFSDVNIVEILQNSLTEQLKNQVFINYRQNLFQSVVLFNELVKAQAKNYQFIFRQLIFKIKQRKYACEQTIISYGQVPQNLSYLINGKIQMSYPNSQYKRIIVHKFDKNKIAEQYKKKQNNYNYGVKQFFTQEALPYNVIPNSFCKVSELQYGDFIQCLKKNRQLYVIIYLIYIQTDINRQNIVSFVIVQKSTNNLI